MISSDQAFESFQKLATNSSHIVWFLADLRFFQSREGWIFGFTERKGVVLLALEPLAPRFGEAEFPEAWKEFIAEIKPRVTLFVSIYAPFTKILEKSGFQTLHVGQEPWVDLKNCIPKGNAGKGVRSARNQAIHAGLKVEEWKESDISSSPEKMATLRKIYRVWNGQRLFQLTGFMNAVDPFKRMSARRYFVLKSPDGKVHAYLIASPVPGIQSYFLEDLVIGIGSPRGTGELLTLEAMVTLQEEGAKDASLGVVSMSSKNSEIAHTQTPSPSNKLPGLIRLITDTVPKALRKVYNFDGMEVYRKRFLPKEWKQIYLALSVQDKGISPTRAWLLALFTLAIAFKPRIRLSLTWIQSFILKPLFKYPLTCFMVIANTSIFFRINQGGNLPDPILTKYGFTSSAPVSEWFMRSIVSDYLYFDKWHFFIWGTAYFAAVFWAEKTQRRKFIIPFVFGVSIFDDLINYCVLIKPFSYFQPVVFNHLISYKDVGSSLGLSTLIGLQFCQFKKIREPLFVVTSLAIVLGFAFTSPELRFLIANLNHAVFFAIGYLTGKVIFEYERYQSRKNAKGKPPEARCVLPASGAERAPNVSELKSNPRVPRQKASREGP
jgi:hypothetical protein